MITTTSTQHLAACNVPLLFYTQTRPCNELKFYHTITTYLLITYSVQNMQNTLPACLPVQNVQSTASTVKTMPPRPHTVYWPARYSTEKEQVTNSLAIVASQTEDTCMHTRLVQVVENGVCWRPADPASKSDREWPISDARCRPMAAGRRAPI